MSCAGSWTLNARQNSVVWKRDRPDRLFARILGSVYFKGGYAWADNQVSATGFGATFAESRFHSGWTVGAGLEYMFVPNWSGKIEYMFADYSNANYLTSFVPGGIGALDW